MKGLDGKAVLVTGAGGAIGRAIARRAAEAGAVVGVLDRDVAGAEETVRGIVAAGGRAHATPADVTDYDAVVAAAAAFERVAGPVEGLVSCAGWDRVAPFLATTPAFWDALIAINFRGVLNVHHAVLRGMAERGRGRVVSISSDAARVGSSGEAVYAGCKGAIVSFTKAVARELAGKRICLNVVCPGPTDTPLLSAFLEEGEYGARMHAGLERAIPFRRLGQPEDLAGLVTFLLSDEAAFITGQVISVSGGLTMAG